jgi:hypothetical protein
MFNVLRTAPFELLTDAAYRISLRIRERERFRNWRKWLSIRPDHQSHPASVAVAVRVLAEIERRTGKPLGDLTDAELQPYQRRIDDILDVRYAAAYPDVDGSAERILEELRRDYGRPDWRAVA